MSGAASYSRKWPRYEIGREDYIFALGVLAANFNYLESWFHRLFVIYVQTPPDANSYLFAKLDNAARVGLLSTCFEASNHSPRVKSALRHFVKGFAICAENRNILLHAQAVPLVATASRGRQRTLFFKNSRKPPYDRNAYGPTITQLRAIADATHDFAIYGLKLGIYITQTTDAARDKSEPLLFAWPRKPAVPRPLAVQPVRFPKPPKAPPTPP